MKRTRSIAVWAGALLPALLGAGCATHTGRGAIGGGALGAGAGALIGHAAGDSGAGALIGLGSGALLGGLIGNELDYQERYAYRRSYDDDAYPPPREYCRREYHCHHYYRHYYPHYYPPYPHYYRRHYRHYHFGYHHHW